MSLTPILLSSPFLGPAVWEPVAAALRRNFGVTALRPDLPDPSPADPSVILEALRKDLPKRDNLLLVPHSNARGCTYQG